MWLVCNWFPFLPSLLGFIKTIGTLHRWTPHLAAHGATAIPSGWLDWPWCWRTLVLIRPVLCPGPADWVAAHPATTHTAGIQSVSHSSSLGSTHCSVTSLAKGRKTVGWKSVGPGLPNSYLSMKSIELGHLHNCKNDGSKEGPILLETAKWRRNRENTRQNGNERSLTNNKIPYHFFTI
jgi:hypothetical protein